MSRPRTWLVAGPDGRLTGQLNRYRPPRRMRRGRGGIACYWLGGDGGSYLGQAYTVRGGRRRVIAAQARMIPAGGSR